MNPQDAKNRIWHYRIDTDGRLWHEGTCFEDAKLLNFFMRKMEPAENGQYVVLCQGETCYIEPEDVPYIILGWEKKDSSIELIFPGAYREILDPKTLWVGEQNVLYCRVRKGSFPARFNRRSYLGLAKLIDFDPVTNQFFLKLNGQRHFIENTRVN